MANGQKASEARASVRYARLSPYKVRFVLNQIRGLTVDDATRVLTFSHRSAADDVRKVLDAAVANAEHSLNADRESLVITRAWADEGPTLQRWRPRAQGRAYRIRKRTTHITVVVEERE